MNWEEVEIRDFGRVVTGKTPPTKEKKYFNGNYCFISPKDLEHDSRYILDSKTKISKLAIDKFKNQVLPKNSIFFTALSFGFGKIGIANELCLTNQQINSIIVDSNKYDFNFIYYLLRNYTPLIRSYDAGIVTPIVPKSVFEKIKINVPKDKITQSKIGNILSAYDDLIQNNLKRIELLEQAAQNIYKEWFVHLRFPGYEDAPINEDTGLPVGWEEKALGEFTEIKKGKNITKSTIIEGNVPVVAGGLKPAYYHNIPNTINPVITVSASGANAGYVNIYLEDIWASDCSYVDSKLSDSVLFIHNLLMHQQELIFGMQRGAAQPHVYPKDLKRAEFIIPDKSLIQNFEEQVSAQYDMKRVLLNQNQKLKVARDILLPRLMNRTIEVS